MRILQVHNRYRPDWGGEDTVADLEAELLSSNGHQVDRLVVSTSELNQAGPLRLAAAGFGTVWSYRGYYAMKRSISRFLPDLVHAHNTFPLLSPSIYWAAHSARIPVVQTLHNFRMTCTNAILLRDGSPCQLCVNRAPWPALRHRCSGSFLRTASVASMNMVHRWFGTYTSKVHSYIALGDFSKEIMVRAGLPEHRIFVKPNFTNVSAAYVEGRRAQIVFVGDISRHKGVHLLLAAWASTPHNGIQLVLIGDGPDKVDLQRRYAHDRRILWHGARPHTDVVKEIAASRFLVLPSLCYENCPMVLLEAFSLGTPVIVPEHGAFSSIVTGDDHGLFFKAGSEQALKCAIHAAVESIDEKWARWSSNVLRKHMTELSASRNYAQLMGIYRNTMDYCQALPKRNV